MQNIDIFRLVLGSLMTLVTIYSLIGLFPAVAQRQLTFQRRIKRGGGTIMRTSRLTRVFGALMCAFLAAQVFAEAFHCSLSSSSLFHFTFMFVLTIVIILYIRDSRRFG
jgi:hypothetical protein